MAIPTSMTLDQISCMVCHPCTILSMSAPISVMLAAGSTSRMLKVPVLR
jgi:hypothetical protein